MDNNEPESFIVQNVTMNYHFISDIRMQFDPLAVIDLTWMDSKIVKASKDLRDALRKGYLRQISQDDWDKKLEKQAIKERNEILGKKKSRQMEKMEVDGKELEVESIDAEKPYNRENELSTAGYANDALSYAIALEIAQTEAQLHGDDLSVEEFADKVQRDPGLVGRLVNRGKSGVTSGETKRGRAYVAQAPSQGQSQTRVANMKMTNMQRDGYIAGGDFNYLDAPDTNEFGFDDAPIAEEIDLESDFSGDDEKGSIRRL